MKPQPATSETRPVAEKPVGTNPTTAPAESKNAEVAAQPEPTATSDPGKSTEGTAATAAAPPIQSKEEAGALRSLETDNVLAKANVMAAATERQPVSGITQKRKLPPEIDPNNMTDELKDAVAKLKHPRTDVKIEWIAWISSMKNASAAVPSLIRLLNDQEDSVRSNAAWGIGKMGEDAKDAVPFLLDALNDRCCDVRLFAATALGEIGDPSAIGPLGTLARVDKDWTLRRAVKDALRKLNK
jgi:HEAT repeat protein